MINVKLRESQLKDGRVSLYLDYYPPIVNPKTGKSTRREYLKLYYKKNTKDPLERQKNEIIKAAADKIRIERTNSLLTGAFEEGSFFAQEESFLEFFKKESKKRATSDGNYNTWKSSYAYFCRFTNNRCKFKDITEKLCRDFKMYLERTTTLKSEMNKLSPNSKHMYYNKFKAAIKEAFLQGLISKKFTSRIQSPKAENPFREFLEDDEIKKLMETPCEVDTIKRAALFCIVTGLRVSDVFPLKWNSYSYDSINKHSLRLKSAKMGDHIYHPISEQAFELMGKIGGNNDQVFRGLKYSANNNKLLERWLHLAGIKKKITWHNFRHTYAVIVIEKHGIYAGKEMLHHKNLKTTEIYSHMKIGQRVKIANSIII
ncbi:tyrosine-type recombinase/integrase [Sphingobacterium rhinopitheci]|uniref:tyrosine-type recombinase/integrase n=1 Tax=Sphingobacterium rhinopitheci TaxID=2781960 RepID=UPI001F5287CE|nr:site-specific integrase [Sphingobacterium rhinopitheci]MCI0922760.1 site-specific integrase [Sphingobacterium rhinopitheci]